jgi:uroporphyrinogen-III decarboxylase
MTARLDELITDPRASINGRHRTAQSLYIAGIMLFLAGINTFAFSLFPIKLVDPLWQLNLCTSILSNSPFLLIACLFVLAASALNQRDKQINRRATSLSIFSRWLSLILLLSIPFQLYLGTQAIKIQNQAVMEQVQVISRVAKGVKATTNEQELRAFAATLPDPVNLPAKIDIPFEAFKQRIGERLQGNINRALEQASQQKSKNIQTYIKEFTRNAIQSIILSTGFAAVAALKNENYGLHSILISMLRL